MFRPALLLGLLISTAAIAQDAPPAPAPAAPTAAELQMRNGELNAVLPPAQAAMKAHVMFLASDAMRGRDAGSPEYDIAANYVASQFYAAGLRPAGDDGSYLQKVPLIKVGPADIGKLSLNGQALTFGQDYLPGVNPAAAETTLAAPVVYVGYGVVSPTRDDYAGLDVRGKIVAVVRGAPDGLDSEEAAHFGGLPAKAAIAKAKGAIGIIALQTPEVSVRMPMAKTVATAQPTSVTWAEADGKGHIMGGGVPTLATLSAAGAEKLFAGSGMSWAKAATALSGKGKFRGTALKPTLAVAIKTVTTPLPSYNVAGILPGSDPTVAPETVVLSAHLDHVGVGSPNKKGDTIYNGAMDNAVGIASLIEEAKRFKAAGKAPRRSILFLAVTAEEKGLVGSDYFANNPTIDKARMVADVNLDMPIITYKFTDVIAFGAARSSLGDIVKRAAATAGATFSPDPMPEMALFVRSDHYRFVQQGVPSVFLWPGTSGPGKAAVDAFFANNYHQPSDEVVQGPPIDWESGERFINVNYQIARDIADAPQRPAWNKGDFFGTLYNGYGAK
ncbi:MULTISPECIES: M20/M25/M40 family metallo-hydrolase [unclassified Sphingomonas]|uniref:M20/M25/M40 family metallo-hydrolase n=1 Tax=unclassified Sphingomonas TaxID=196159 RepID=UPI0006FA92DC|nr:MULTISPECIES: M20/M25/M40 family metallo-hydrolase [unclassified Sphingomonas]KQM58923.1 aminopeptidase [Sphingomonas sp. Leaf16]KQN11178.1 aminopeptidase [Sphingomonas sp. Leaf29]KQN18476.1 aminopeptidase [Sphingomonas sp. Leaf32]